MLASMCWAGSRRSRPHCSRASTSRSTRRSSTTGDFVIVTNAEGVRLTGAKDEQKLYRYHSGHQGGLREERAKTLRRRMPARMVEEAVRGMLPKTKLGNAMYRKLKVYAGPNHPHAAQQPTPFAVS